MNNFSFKELQTRRAKLEAKIHRLKQELKDIQSALSYEEDKLTRINSQIRNFSKDLVITEHAVLQFLIKHKGLDVQAIKQELAPDPLKDQIKTLGSGKFPGPDGRTLVVKNNVVVTTL